MNNSVKCLYLLIIIFHSHDAISQQIFQRDYSFNNGGYSRGSAFAITSNNDKMIVGSEFVTSGDKNLLICRSDSIGHITWSKSLDCDSCNLWVAEQIKMMDDSTFVITSFLSTPTGMTYDYYGTSILKINEFGDIDWINHLKDTTFLYEYYISNIHCTNNDCYGVGNTKMNFNFTSNSDTTYYGLFLKFDENGSILWAKKYGVNSTQINDFVQVDDGFILIGNETIVDSIGTNVRLKYFKVDSSGTVIWSYSWNMYGSLNQIVQNGANFILGGYFFTMTDQDAFLFEIDSLGTVVWSKRYGNLGTGSDNINFLIKHGPNKFAISSGAHTFTILDSIGGNPTKHNISYYSTGRINHFYAEADGGISGIGATAPIGKMHIFKTDSNYYNCTNYVFNYPVSPLSITTIFDSTESESINIDNLFIQATEFNQIAYDSTLCETATNLNGNTGIQDDLVIYPNPCNSYFDIDLGNIDNKHFIIDIYDAKGILVKQIFCEKEKVRVDVLNLNSGIFILVINENNYHIVKKFIKL